MKDERVQIRGNKDGVNVIIDMDKFSCFDNMLDVVIASLSKNKGFYKNSILKITSNLKSIQDYEITKLKDELFEKIKIKDAGEEYNIMKITNKLVIENRRAKHNYEVLDKLKIK